MTAPIPQGGNLVGAIAAPFSDKTFTGSASAVDYLTTNNPNNNAFFADLVQRGSSLIYTLSDPFTNKVSIYTLPMLGTTNAIEYFSSDNGTGTTTGLYNLVAPGDYRTNTTFSGIRNYGTNGNDVVYGLLGATQLNQLSGSAGDDLLVGGAGTNVLSGGTGLNTLIGGSGINRYKIEVADKATNTITANGSNNQIQILLSNTSFDWNFEKVGNDAVGWITDIDGNTSNFVLKNQFTTNPIDSIVIYVNGYATDGSSYTGGGFLSPGVGSYTGTTQFFIGDSASNNLDLSTTTRSTVRLFGNGGNDSASSAPIATRQVFSGGDGIDKVIYTEALNKFTLTVSNQITQSASGRKIDFATIGHASKATADSLTNVERLQFTDTSVALDIGPTQNAGSVYMLYKAAFNRAPDASGMGYWLAQKDGGSNIVTNIAQGFVNAPEFTAKYGANPTNASYVDKLYQNVLGRAGESGGVAYWNQELDAGRISKAAVLVQFATLAEGASIVAPLIAKGIPYTEFLG